MAADTESKKYGPVKYDRVGEIVAVSVWGYVVYARIGSRWFFPLKMFDQVS